MAVHVACSWPGSVAHGLLQRVEVSGFRLSRRASATQQKCRKIQAPKGLREMASGRRANVNFLSVFTGQNGPPIQKFILNLEAGGGKRKGKRTRKPKADKSELFASLEFKIGIYVTFLFV